MSESEPPKFGTSGLRGLVTGLTPELVARHVAGFVRACDTGDTVLIAEDLRAANASAVISGIMIWPVLLR